MNSNKNAHYDGSKDKPLMTFVPNTNARGIAHPIRFEKLRPGSYFRIMAEPSRNIRQSNDNRIYQKHHNAFCAQHVSSSLGIVLMPNDLVIPYRQSRL